MRNAFIKTITELMKKNKNIWFLTADVGYGLFDDIQEKFPDRFLNCGISEQAMIGMAVGLSNSGKIPFVYSMTPFVLYRPYEFIRVLVHYDKANVKIIASGRNKDYDDHNYSHYGTEDKIVMKSLFNIKGCWPKTKKEIPLLLEEAVKSKEPYYINIKRK